MNYSAKVKILTSLLALLFVMSVDVAWAWSNQISPSEGSTATVAVEVDPIEKYRNAKKLTNDELIDLLKLTGFKGEKLKIAWAVAMRESTGRPTSHNDTPSTGDDSYGLFQINMIGTLGSDRIDKFQQNGIQIDTKKQLFDPVVNAQVAFYMTAKGTNWGSWGYGPHAYDGDPSEPGIELWISRFSE